jgi:hypothetical protein
MPLAAPQRGGVGRLGQVRGDPGGEQLLDHAPPAGAALQREVDLIQPGEPGQPLAQVLPVGGDHPAPLQLPGASVQVLERELAAVHIECAYDAHEGPPRAPTEIGTWDLAP